MRSNSAASFQLRTAAHVLAAVLARLLEQRGQFSAQDGERIAARRTENISLRMGGWWWALSPLGLGSSQTAESLIARD